ncbi:MAG: hypothetical protein QM729_21215 [Solirubrobacterales bacterium]
MTNAKQFGSFELSEVKHNGLEVQPANFGAFGLWGEVNDIARAMRAQSKTGTLAVLVVVPVLRNERTIDIGGDL